jgi:hypothetical protein
VSRCAPVRRTAPATDEGRGALAEAVSPADRVVAPPVARKHQSGMGRLAQVARAGSDADCSWDPRDHYRAPRAALLRCLQSSGSSSQIVNVDSASPITQKRSDTTSHGQFSMCARRHLSPSRNDCGDRAVLGNSCRVEGPPSRRAARSVNDMRSVIEAMGALLGAGSRGDRQRTPGAGRPPFHRPRSRDMAHRTVSCSLRACESESARLDGASAAWAFFFHPGIVIRPSCPTPSDDRGTSRKGLR